MAFRVRSRFEFKLQRRVGVVICAVRVWQYEEEEKNCRGNETRDVAMLGTGEHAITRTKPLRSM
jgi:hypothetical protein